jgi:hypothetical protein
MKLPGPVAVTGLKFSATKACDGPASSVAARQAAKEQLLSYLLDS